MGSTALSLFSTQVLDPHRFYDRICKTALLGSVFYSKKRVPTFLHQLWQLLEQPPRHAWIVWEEGGSVGEVTLALVTPW